jgi:hypothetical protein
MRTESSSLYPTILREPVQGQRLALLAILNLNLNLNLCFISYCVIYSYYTFKA